MDDEPSSSASVAAAHDAQHGDDDRSYTPDTVPTAAEIAKRTGMDRELFNRKRGLLLDGLLRNLDLLIYAELSIIYYMDCSFLRFLLRAFVQFVFLTPKPAIFPEPPRGQPFMGFIAMSNVVCILFHIWLSPPSAGEATRAYLHGGLAMDFIGQKGPTSRFHLLLLDLLVVILQLVHLSASMVKQRLKEVSVSTAVEGAQSAASAANIGQDIDAEERGIRRSDETQDIEMRILDASGSAVTAAATPSAEDAPEGDSLLTSTAARSDAQIFDAFNSGQIVLVDIDIWRTIKSYPAHLATTQPESTRLSQRSQALRTQLAGRVWNMRFGGEMLGRGF